VAPFATTVVVTAAAAAAAAAATATYYRLHRHSWYMNMMLFQFVCCRSTGI